MADGKLFIGKKALEAGLVDRLGRFKSVLVADSANVPLAASVATPIASTTTIEIEAFTHNSKTAESEPEWGSVDKTKLPNLGHARMGEKKSDRGYPHHFIVGGSNLDKDGCYTDGTMYLHKGGLNAAWSAAHGARSGQKASPDIIAHLEAHRRALGLDKNENKTQTQTKEAIMDLQELKETYPDFIKAIVTEAQASLVEENQKLKADVETLDKVNKDLVKEVMINKERSESGLAAKIKQDILDASSVSANLHSKVSGMVDYRDFIGVDGKFEGDSDAVKAFTAAFQTEVTDCETKLSASHGVGVVDPKKDVATKTEADKQLIDRVLSM